MGYGDINNLSCDMRYAMARGFAGGIGRTAVHRTRCATRICRISTTALLLIERSIKRL
ncbi:hypothetical protein PSEUDO9AG_50761 [Pseudomonas sp. 9Ag]|nr:hypothetical protein PSEUDO9AG_50761 [Pseudomonas sp. 9Ag]